MAVGKFNLCRNATAYWAQENVYVSEPVFAPRPGGTAEAPPNVRNIAFK